MLYSDQCFLIGMDTAKMDQTRVLNCGMRIHISSYDTRIYWLISDYNVRYIGKLRHRTPKNPVMYPPI